MSGTRLSHIFGVFAVLAFFLLGPQELAVAQTPTVPAPIRVITRPTPSPTVSPTPSPTPTSIPETKITEIEEETIEPLKKLLQEQKLGAVWPRNPIKYAIRSAVDAGVPANTIVLLLLLPGVAAIIAGVRHIVGLRGFGIFLPAALSIVLVATGPILGIVLFLIIVFVSTVFRITLRKLKTRLQYLPRMAMLLWAVCFGLLLILFATPFIKQPDLTSVSIFPVLILVLLAEDFTRVQLGKSAKTAINITTETLILALISYIFLTTRAVQEFALLNPEVLLVAVLIFDFIVGKYVGLRFLEFWRFRKLISG